MKQETATVFVVDDDPAARAAVCEIVQSMGLKAVAYASADEFLASADGQVHGCIVADMGMLGLSGIEFQQRLHEREITLPIIVVSANANIPMTVRVMKNGAVTVLEKPCGKQELWDAISAAVARHARVKEQVAKCREIRRRLQNLTGDERSVMDLMLAGEPNKAIALRLDVSQRTVESRRRSVFQKMRTSSVAELVRCLTDGQRRDEVERGRF